MQIVMEYLDAMHPERTNAFAETMNQENHPTFVDT
jgi:hypothetical protein